MSVKYKRVLLKLSGEQLAGKQEFGIDPEVARYIAGELKSIIESGVQVVIIVGGGNMVRGASLAGKSHIKRVTADQMGMLSGLINAMALTDIFEAEGLTTRCLSNIFVEQLAESFSFRLAEKHLSNGRLLLVAGGTGRPYSTHDTAAVLTGLELDCEIVIKTSKVDGVYDKDPAKHSDARKLDKLSFQQAVEDANIMVMDKAAMGLALEHNMPVMVLDAMQPGNILRAIQGDNVGTTIS
ncbi:MAG: UMP kinase [Candidatus Saccharimonadales bacterium]